MSEQKENAQLEAYRKLVEDFKRFVSSEIRAEENSYRIVDMTSEDAEINDPSVPVTQLEDDKAEKLAGICMDLSNATLWLYYNRDKFANVEFMPLTDETLKEYQKQAQNALNEPKSPLYLKSWYQLIEMLSQECIPQRYEDDGQRYTDALCEHLYAHVPDHDPTQEWRHLYAPCKRAGKRCCENHDHRNVLLLQPFDGSLH